MSAFCFSAKCFCQRQSRYHLLVLGGLYLAYEGAEKSMNTSSSRAFCDSDLGKGLTDEEVKAAEKEKIKVGNCPQIFHSIVEIVIIALEKQFADKQLQPRIGVSQLIAF